MARIVVTGGAGFLGSHLCRALLDRGDQVVAVDNLVTGSVSNIEELFGHRGFTFVEHDVSQYVWVPGAVDAVMHFASPASPIDFERIPIQILKVGGLGTHNCLGLAKAKGAKFFLASTSEVYGDPQVHPQPETYWGHVNPIGPRGVYDEAKRFAEAMTMAYHRHHGLDVRIVRIFNTYGPQMRADDGRSVSNFLVQALRGEPITVFGDGSQTRSFCYVDDEVRGFLALLDGDITGPINIGNPDEFTIRAARRDGRRGHRLVVDDHRTSRCPVDDPTQRQPDLTLARTLLGWEPEIQLRDGLDRTAEYFRRALEPAEPDRSVADGMTERASIGRVRPTMADVQEVRSPLQGTIVSIEVAAGDVVGAGAVLLLDRVDEDAPRRRRRRRRARRRAPRRRRRRR